MKKNILVIDDCLFFRTAIKDQLYQDFNVETVDSGEKAINILQKIDSGELGNYKPFDLIITDFMMPGLNGYEVAKYVRGKNRTNKFMPVIMVSGSEIDKDEARAHGCSTFFPKSDLKKIASVARILLI